MTIITGYTDGKNTWLAGDRAASEENNVTCIAKPKVFVKSVEGCGEIAIGYASSFRMGQLLEYKFSPPELRKCSLDHYLNTEFIDEVARVLHENNYASETNNVRLGGTFMLGVMGRVFTVQDDFSVIEGSASFAAIGCGYQYALGAMSALSKHSGSTGEDVAKEGVSAAMKYSPYCGVYGEIDFVMV